MKKLIFLVALFLPVLSQAKMDERECGLYTIVGDKSIPLEFTVGFQSSVGVGTYVGPVGIGAGADFFSFGGATSGVPASDTFVFVFDPEKTTAYVSPNNCGIFVRSMTPSNFLVIPLSVNVEADKRGCNSWTIMHSIGGDEAMRKDIEWEQISDNSYKIKVHGLVPGEYAFVFRMARMGTFCFNYIFGFTILDQETETMFDSIASK